MSSVQLSALVYHISENEALRYLDYNDWDVEATFKHLSKKSDDFKKFKYPFEMDESVKKVQKSKLAYMKNTDRDGRPIIYAKLANFFPGSKISDKDYQKFFYYTVEQIYKTIAPSDKVSSAVLLIDVKDSGYKNLGIQTSMKITHILFTIYVGATSKIILVNANWLLDVVLTALTPVLPQEVLDSLKHFKVGDKDGVKKELLKTINVEDIPKEYGGEATVTKEDYLI
jgi:hypothetical protein